MLTALSGGGNLVLLLHQHCGLLFSTRLPPRPWCRGLDEEAGSAAVLAALWRTSQGLQNPSRHARENGS